MQLLFCHKPFRILEIKNNKCASNSFCFYMAHKSTFFIKNIGQNDTLSKNKKKNINVKMCYLMLTF